MKKLFLSIVACFLVGNMAMAQSWVSFTNATPEAPIVNLTASDRGLHPQSLAVSGNSFTGSGYRSR